MTFRVANFQAMDDMQKFTQDVVQSIIGLFIFRTIVHSPVIISTYLINRNTVSANLGNNSRLALVHKQPKTQFVSGV